MIPFQINCNLKQITHKMIKVFNIETKLQRVLKKKIHTEQEICQLILQLKIPYTKNYKVENIYIRKCQEILINFNPRK